MPGTLLLAGCGKMGGALLEGWLAQGMAAADVTVVEPDTATAKAIHDRHGVAVVAGAGDIADGLAPMAVVFAVKPQVIDDVVPAYARFAGTGTVFLSIAAGTPLAFFEDRLGAGAAVVRAMPNTPAAVGRGITVVCANAAATDDQVAHCQSLLDAVGEVARIDDEGLMDAVTAVSGSGPAYVFLLAECLAAAGVAAGLPGDLSERLARATVAGSGELLHQAGESAAELRRNVTSPGGTTAAALEILMADDGLEPLMTEAVAAAAKRARELGG